MRVRSPPSAPNPFKVIEARSVTWLAGPIITPALSSPADRAAVRAGLQLQIERNLAVLLKVDTAEVIMFQNRLLKIVAAPDLVRSVLTGALITKESEAYRHEREVEFLSTLSAGALEEILTGCIGKHCHRSLTAIRGPAEVKFLRGEIVLFQGFSANSN